MKRHFIIFFWGTRFIDRPIPGQNPAVGAEIKTMKIETQFYSNMDCTTDGEYPALEEIMATGKQQLKAEKLVVTGIQELNAKDFEDWNKPLGK
jgi:hypothetical protein